MRPRVLGYSTENGSPAQVSAAGKQELEIFHDRSADSSTPAGMRRKRRTCSDPRLSYPSCWCKGLPTGGTTVSSNVNTPIYQNQKQAERLPPHPCLCVRDLATLLKQQQTASCMRTHRHIVLSLPVRVRRGPTFVSEQEMGGTRHHRATEKRNGHGCQRDSLCYGYQEGERKRAGGCVLLDDIGARRARGNSADPRCASPR